MSDLLQAALEYAELGYSVFPCKPMSKEPATPNGFKDATREEEIINFWWKANPHYNLAICTTGLVVIDYDDPYPGKWPPWPLMKDPFTGPFYHTPRGSGSHTIGLQPPGAKWRNTTKKLAYNIDTRADGGYVICPPSETPEGQYRWPQGSTGMFWPSVVPDWFILEIEQCTNPNGTNLPHDFLDATRPIPDGQQNSTLAQIGGWLRRHGFSEGQIYASLLKISEDRCVDSDGNSWPHPEARVAKIAASVARYEPSIDAIGAMEGVEITPDEQTEAKYPHPGELPEEIVFNLPGLAEKVIEYTLKTSPCQQPTYALAGAMALMSTITGRRLEDHSRTRTNLLCVMLGETGSGKDRPRQVNRQLLTAAECDYLGPEEAVSGNGIYTSINTRPNVLLQWDEMGLLFKQIQSGRSDGPLANARAILMKLYHNSAETIPGGGYADPKRNFKLVQPHLTLLGSTIIDNFAAGMTREQLTDGFISRLSPFPSFLEPFPGDPPHIDLPPGVILAMQEWRDIYKKRGNLAEEDPHPIQVTYTSDAWDRLSEFRKELHAKPDRAIWIRNYIQAKKGSMIYTASDVGPKIVTIPLIAVEWAIALVTYQTRFILYLADQFIADSELEADLLEFERWMCVKGKVTMMQVCKSKFRKWHSKHRKEVMDSLVAQGKLTVLMTTGLGRPTTVLTWNVRKPT